jgi:membrane protein required for colicin V production
VNWLDIAIAVIFIWFTFAAFHAGFIRETVTVVACVLGAIAAGILYDDLADEVFVFIDNATAARIVAFTVIFGTIALAGQLMAMVLKPTVSMFQLGIFDQLTGAAFGFAKAFIVVQLFLVLFITYPRWDMPESIDESVFGSLMVDGGAMVLRVLPEEFEGAVDEFNAHNTTNSET